jgi:CRISPR-associated protein Csx10
MTVRLTFEIKLLSDYHVGSGHGLGTIDSALLRDGDGVPVLRGSMIAGLLRDGLWRLLQKEPLRDQRGCQVSGLGEDKPRYCQPGADACPLCRIFGTPARPKPWRFTSARPLDAETPGTPKPGIAGPEGHVVRHVRINPRTRRAEPRKLFSRETGQAYWIFRFDAACDATDHDMIDEAALLVAAAREVRGLGRARRRGQGECRLELVQAEGLTTPGKAGTLTEQWLGVFKTRWLDGLLVAGSKPGQRAVPDMTPAGGPVRLRVLVRADEPLLLAQRAEAGNEFETLSIVPGTVLLGALAGRAATLYDLEGEPAARHAFVQLFLRGRVNFRALLPAQYDGRGAIHPAIRAPLDLLTCKVYPGFEGDAHGAAGYARGDRDPGRCQICREQHQADTPLRPLLGFVTVREQPKRFEPAHCHEMHIAVEPVSGRVGEGDLYGYVSLEAGQYFLGELVCVDTSAWKALQQMADLPEPGELFTLRIGKAFRRGHGQVSVVLERVLADGADPWSGASLAERVKDLSAPLVLTLLTDTILSDPWGRFRVGFDETWLEELLGVPVEIVRAFAQARRVDGFFGHLGLPRFRDLALVAGSAVGITFPDGPPDDLPDRLAAIERDGIGLRREEGYGRVAFNHPIYAGCAGMPDTALTVPDRLRPGELSDRAVAADIAAFRSNWEETLNKAQKTPDKWRHLNFDAVARILRHGAGGSLDDLTLRLGKLGQPENLLGGDLRGPRKENFFAAEGKPGQDGILQLLNALSVELDRHPAAQMTQLRRLGVEMLADRVAAAVDRKGQRR